MLKPYILKDSSLSLFLSLSLPLSLNLFFRFLLTKLFDFLCKQYIYIIAALFAKRLTYNFIYSRGGGAI